MMMLLRRAALPRPLLQAGPRRSRFSETPASLKMLRRWLPSAVSPRSRPNAHEDIEMAADPTLEQEGEAAAAPRGRDLAINELFGLHNREDRNKYPGVDHFFYHVEKVCFPQFAEFNKAIWDVMQIECTTDHSQKWEWCAHVIETCRSLQNSNPTVGALATEFLSAHGKPNIIFRELDEHLQFAIVEALLHTLCWLSATIMPVVEKHDLVDVRTSKGTAKAFSLTALYNGKTIICSVALNSTLSDIFQRINQAAVPTPMDMDGNRLTCATGDVLHEPCVTYASLRKYAGVRLKWVSSLSEHLSLDRNTNVLSVFRYPSVCAVRVLNRNKCEVIANITNRLLPGRHYARPNEVENEENVCQQVILSYRLLFGQSTASRNRLKEELVELVESTAESTRNGPFVLRCTGKARNAWKVIRSQWALFWQSKIFRKLLKDESGESTAESMPDDPFILQCIDEFPSSWKVWVGLAKPDPPFSPAILPARFRRDDGSIKEWSTYFARIHFDSFTWRLLAIQTFGNDHPPRAFLDYVMDPRAPMQRAAARVGVVAVVLAVSFGTVQASLAARQLVGA